MQELNEQYSKEEQYLYFSDEYYDPLLEYVTILAEEYCPVTAANYVGHYCSRAIGCFAISYFDNKIDESSLNKYLDSNDVQETIKALGYDVDKFWYLLLFIYDFSFGACNNGIKFPKTPKEKLEEFGYEIIHNLATYDESKINFVTFKEPAKIVLEIKGKRKIVIDDPNTVAHIGGMLHHEANQIDKGHRLNYYSVSGKMLNGKMLFDTLPNSIHIWYFAKLFLSFFELKPPQKVRAKKGSLISYNKNLLISRLIYIMGLSENENFLESDDTLKGYLRQYKNFKMDIYNMRYS